MEMETDPFCTSLPVLLSLFLLLIFFFPFSLSLLFFSLSLKHSHSRKNPITAISGPCWKRDSLWNVFGVTQRQCLSCPSANRMLCAGERHKIRTDNGKWERPKKKKKATKRAEDNLDRERKKQQWDRWCRGDMMTPRETKKKKDQWYSYSITMIPVQEIEWCVTTWSKILQDIVFLLFRLLLPISSCFLTIQYNAATSFNKWCFLTQVVKGSGAIAGSAHSHRWQELVS